MERKPLSTSSIVGAVVLLVVVLLGLYVGGYFVLGTFGKKLGFDSRWYRYDWLALSYCPLVRVEVALTGNDVLIHSPNILHVYTARGYDYELEPVP